MQVVFLLLEAAQVPNCFFSFAIAVTEPGFWLTDGDFDAIRWRQAVEIQTRVIK